MRTEYFLANKLYIIVAVTDNYSIETYTASYDIILDKIREQLIEERGYYRSYVVYKLCDDKYCDIERWTAKNGKEVKNEN